MLHGPFGEDGTVQGLLECLDVPYVGPGVLAAAVAIDKLIFKRLLAFHGIPQVGFCEVGEDGWREQVADDGPAAVGEAGAAWARASGSRKVTSPERGLDEAVELARRHDPRVIVEADGGGKEVECSVIGNEVPADLAAGRDRRPRRLVRLRGQVRRGRHGPDRPGADHATPRRRASASSPRRSSGRSTARGLARCDFFVRDDGEVLVNELNTIPGFTSTSVFAKLFEADGVPYPELCDRLVRLALERHETERGYRVLAASRRR